MAKRKQRTALEKALSSRQMKILGARVAVPRKNQTKRKA
jgi:hypothetical protein